jgi:hypothetical protein
MSKGSPMHGIQVSCLQAFMELGMKIFETLSGSCGVDEGDIILNGARLVCFPRSNEYAPKNEVVERDFSPKVLGDWAAR